MRSRSIPALLIADEPTTALDVTIQAQILDLMLELKARHEAGAILLITHNLAVVAETCDRVAVMYGGKIQEVAPVRELFYNPLHPYTRGLLGSLPRVDGEKAGPADDDSGLGARHSQPSASAASSRRAVPSGSSRAPTSSRRSSRPRRITGCAATSTTTAMDTSDAILDVQDLKVRFPVFGGVIPRKKGEVRAVDGVSFTLYRGETIGLVGESGCGKTTVGRAIVNILRAMNYRVEIEGKVLYHRGGEVVDLAALSRA